MMAEGAPRDWKPWTFQHVVDVASPAFALRTYLEQADVRSYLWQIAAHRPLNQACDVGCGYGRMSVVLGEFVSRVVGFERQPEFVEEAPRLHPGVTVHEVSVQQAIREIKRVVGPSGGVLICEETG